MKVLVGLISGVIGIGIGIAIGRAMSSSVVLDPEKLDLGTLSKKITDAKAKAEAEIAIREKQLKDLEAALMIGDGTQTKGGVPVPPMAPEEKKKREKLRNRIKRELAEWKERRRKHKEQEALLAGQKNESKSVSADGWKS